MTAINTLKTLLFARNDFCCLCLKQNIPETEFQISDEVFLDSNINALRLDQLLATLLGEDILQNIFNHKICEKCVSSALASYKFYQICKQNSKILRKMVQNFEDSLNNIEDNLDTMNTVFVSLDTNNSKSQQIFDKQINKSKKQALGRLEILLNPTSKIAIEYNSMRHLPKDKQKKLLKDNIVKNNKKKIQTSDMMLNINDKSCFQCRICHKIFPRSYNLRHHFFRAHNPRVYKCTKCPRSYGLQKILDEHYENSHCSVICSECGRTFGNRSTLLRHEKSHKTRYVCQTCGKVYKTKVSCNKHVCGQRKSTQVKYICDYCQKSYSTRGSLVIHIKFEHLKSTLYECMWCDKKFHASSVLKNHLLMHTKEKNFVCMMCGGQFISKASLSKHIRIHTGERPYQCEQCERCFISTSRRAEHVRRVHTIQMVECDICNVKFKDTSIKKHRS